MIHKIYFSIRIKTIKAAFGTKEFYTNRGGFLCFGFLSFGSIRCKGTATPIPKKRLPILHFSWELEHALEAHFRVGPRQTGAALDCSFDAFDCRRLEAGWTWFRWTIQWHVKAKTMVVHVVCVHV